MKYIFSCLVLVWFALPSWSGAADFTAILEARGIDVNALVQQTEVPRATVAELLNSVDCQDCHRPSQENKSTLTTSWWDQFRLFPGKNFDDVIFNDSLDPANQYYCIAYVGNKWYMNWYPRSTSPLCSWRFCGTLSLTNADLIQTVFNITAPLFFSQYKANWGVMSEWLRAQTPAVQNYFGLEDYAHIQVAKNACKETDCSMQSVDEFKTYAKYCTLEPASCGMQEFAFAKAWQWPIAEMNVLEQQWIYTSDDIQNLNIENYADGRSIIDILWRVKQRSQCIDDDDLDNDGLKDQQDNCYLTYNPAQSDRDQDMIWDVCDDDLDNDGIKNPIGIVDDAGNVVYAVVQKLSQQERDRIDNCLLVVNKDQRDDDKNRVGNACDNDERVGIAINPKLLAQSRYAFVAEYSWSLKNFTWYFGDRTTWSGEITNHIYRDAGTYTVRVEATTPKNNIISATSTITIGEPTVAVKPSIAIVPAQITSTKFSFNTDYLGKLTNFIRSFGDGNAGAGETATHTYNTPGTYTVRVQATTSTNTIVSDTVKVTVWTDQLWWNTNLAAIPSQITPTNFSFDATYLGKLTNFIRSFGDGRTWVGETTTHTYAAPGTYIVRVQATTPQGYTVFASTTVTVWWWTTVWVVPWAALLPSKLVQQVWEKTQYAIQLFGITSKDIDYISLQRWDGRTRDLRWQEVVKFTDTYIRNGGYPIWWTVYMADSTTLALSAYVTVLWPEFCLGALGWNRSGRCDIDKDSIPDMCDSDIDGDGIGNQLGIIRFEKPDCTYDVTNINPWVGGNGTQSWWTITSTDGTQWEWWSFSRDNCPFVANPLQWPCIGLEKDSDGDGIVDSKDSCPLVPEAYNDILDADGCPEYDINVSFPPTKLQPGTCSTCPCQYAQNDGLLAPWDRVKAVLFDKTSQKPVAESNRYVVP